MPQSYQTCLAFGYLKFFLLLFGQFKILHTFAFQLNPTIMKNIKFIVLGISLVSVSLLAYGMYLSLTRNYYEEAPKQIEGIDSEKFNFTWYNTRLERDELFTAWYFTPDKTESLSPIFKSADTSYSYNVGDTTVAVFWAKDITIHSVYYKDDLTLHTVYWSDSTN